MRTFLASAAVLAGAAFMFVAALGIARLPDLYTRMQAATKASTVGVVGVMCGVALAHAEASVTIRAVLVAGFFLLTSPVAAHAIARSAHRRAAPPWGGTRVDRGDRARATRAPGYGSAAPREGAGELGDRSARGGASEEARR
jgi:multicomponent Na+:H+ antiporter subunit G